MTQGAIIIPSRIRLRQSLARRHTHRIPGKSRTTDKTLGSILFSNNVNKASLVSVCKKMCRVCQRLRKWFSELDEV